MFFKRIAKLQYIFILEPKGNVSEKAMFRNFSILHQKGYAS